GVRNPYAVLAIRLSAAELPRRPASGPPGSRGAASGLLIQLRRQASAEYAATPDRPSVGLAQGPGSATSPDVWWDVSVAAVDGGLVRSAGWRRIRELAAGPPAWDEPAVLAVAGEAGAGKSTLWRAGVVAAVDAGRRLLRSEPSASETDLSFA